MTPEQWQWIAEHGDEVGIVVVLIFVVVALIEALRREWIVPGYYHRHMLAAGKDAIETLKIVNPQLVQLQITAAVQQERDRIGERELRDLREDLERCERDRTLCWQQRRGEVAS